MPLARWKDLCIDALDQRRVGEFWASVIGLEVAESPGTPPDPLALGGPTDGHRIWFNAVDRPKVAKHRLHLDIYATSVDELVDRGARVLRPAEESGLGWTVMADPEGGEFCCFLRAPDVLPDYRLHGVVIDCVDPAAQAGWWGRAFGVEPVVDRAEDGQVVHTLERVTNDEVLTLDFVAVPEARRGPNRVHWDVTGDRDALVAAGATHRWDTPGWTVLTDPEGNDFCVFATR